MASFDRYRRLLRTPQMRALVAFSLLARLQLGILSLALVLFLREETGSFAVAGAVAAAFALTDGLSMPVQGRIVDRLGQTRVLIPLAVVQAVALAALIWLALVGAPAGLIGAVAALAGCSTPPVSACVRPLMSELLRRDEALLTTGYALDAIMIEASFIVGPLLTAVLAGAFSPATAVAAGAAVGCGGTLALAALPVSRSWRGEGSAGGIAGALASPGIRTLVLTALPIGICFGTLEVTLPAFGHEHGSANIAGLLFAMLSVGSVVGGFAYGAAAERLGSLTRGYLLLAAALPVFLALTAVPDSVVFMVALIPIAGLVIAPLGAAENQLAVGVAPRGSVTEAFTWLSMAIVVGVAGGNAAAGALVQEAGWRTALLASCAVAAAGAALSIARRSTLRIPAPERA